MNASTVNASTMNLATRLSAIATLSLTLAACGSGTTATTPTASTAATSSATPMASADARHDAADVTFARDMVVHHEGAIAMADLAATNASSAGVKDLAGRIKEAQGPQVTQMTSWLEAWGAPVLAADAMSGMDGSSDAMSSGSMSSDPMSSGSPGSGSVRGMMTDEQMSRLRAATGPDFDRMFLQLMTVHHEGAIDMARTEETDGSNPAAIALARSIQASQTAEVAQMQQLLATLGS